MSTAIQALQRALASRRLPTLVAVSLGVFATLLVERAPVGFFHDDAIYVATAQSLRTSGEYRLINLPTHPPQTKYVPGYPVALAMVDALTPFGVDATYVFRLANCVMYVVTLLLAAGILRAVDGLTVWDQAVLLLVFAITPGVLTYTDFVLSETLFLLWVTLFFRVLQEKSPAAAVGAGAIAALATLTRPIGITLVPALLWALRARPRLAITASALPVAALAVWLIWAQQASGAGTSPLLSYYTTYEPSLYSTVLDDPEFVLRALARNAGTLHGMMGLVLGPTAGALIWVLILTAVALAVVTSQPSGILRPLLLFAAAHHVVMLGHPFPMARYLVPWSLVLFVSLAALTAHGRGAVTAGSWWGIARHAGPLLALIVLIGGIVATRIYAADRGGRVHAEFGFTTRFGWDGFLETADWIRGHTPADAVLASGYDSFYFLQTQRVGIRPWLHIPSTLLEFPERLPNAQTRRQQTAMELRRLGVSHLVVDPVLDSKQGQYLSRRNRRCAPRRQLRLERGLRQSRRPASGVPPLSLETRPTGLRSYGLSKLEM